jgi:hypothetical protein
MGRAIRVAWRGIGWWKAICIRLHGLRRLSEIRALRRRVAISRMLLRILRFCQFDNPTFV